MTIDSPITIINPTISVGPEKNGFAPLPRSRIRNEFLKIVRLYGFSALSVLICLASNDQEVASSVLEELKSQKLIRIVPSDQQLSGELIKLTPRGVDYVEAMIGVPAEKKYDPRAGTSKEACVSHDISSQLYICRQILRGNIKHFAPEAAMNYEDANKEFDVIIITHDILIVGIEIERTVKYGKDFAAAMSKTILAVQDGDVDFALFLMTTEFNANRYDRVFDQESLVLYKKCRGRWVNDGIHALEFDDVMRVGCLVGRREMWKGAL